MKKTIKNDGIILNEKFERVISYFAKAGRNDPDVWSKLATIYEDGLGVVQDKSRARRFERRARETVAKNRDIVRRKLRRLASGYLPSANHKFARAA